MSKKASQEQWIIIVVLVVALVVAIGVATFLGTNKEGGPSGLTSGKRFTAKPGTSRDNAVALSSRNRGFMGGGSGSSSSGTGSDEADGEEAPPPRTDSKPLRVRSLSGVEEEAELTDTERMIREAENTLSPNDGLTKLREALDSAPSDEDRAAIYTAMAGLAAQLDPPDTAYADQMFDLARSHARTPEARGKVARAETSALIQRGAWALAAQRAQEALASGAGPALDTAALQNVLGLVAEHNGDGAAARAAYEAAFDAARKATDGGKEREMLMRHAGMMLAQTYRAAGNTEAAVATAETLNRELAMPSTGPEMEVVVE
ncbi:MAG: hypothetical protein GC168_15305 [Candidatus Hydrogenedens sp.]|nr:hypothetical protein [Candidatus Hydrogenedens sp.]